MPKDQTITNTAVMTHSTATEITTTNEVSTRWASRT